MDSRERLKNALRRASVDDVESLRALCRTLIRYGYNKASKHSFAEVTVEQVNGWIETHDVRYVTTMTGNKRHLMLGGTYYAYCGGAHRYEFHNSQEIDLEELKDTNLWCKTCFKSMRAEISKKEGET